MLVDLFRFRVIIFLHFIFIYIFFHFLCCILYLKAHYIKVICAHFKFILKSLFGDSSHYDFYFVFCKKRSAATCVSL